MVSSMVRMWNRTTESNDSIPNLSEEEMERPTSLLDYPNFPFNVDLFVLGSNPFAH